MRHSHSAAIRAASLASQCAGRAFAQVKVSDLRELPVPRLPPIAQGEADPLWMEGRAGIREWVDSGRKERLLRFMADRIGADPLFPRERGGLLQVMAAEIVLRLQSLRALPDDERMGRLSQRLQSVLDAIFDRLLGGP